MIYNKINDLTIQRFANKTCGRRGFLKIRHQGYRRSMECQYEASEVLEIVREVVR